MTLKYTVLAILAVTTVMGMTAAFAQESSDNTSTTLVYEVLVDQKIINVEYSITGGIALNNFEINEEFSSIILSLDILDGGILVIDVPRELIDSKFNGVDDDFIVLVDGDEPLNYSEIQTNSQSRTLSIGLVPGSEQIEIVGGIHFGDEPEPEPMLPHEVIEDLQNQISELGAEINGQWEEIDYLYTITNDLESTIINQQNTITELNQKVSSIDTLVNSINAFLSGYFINY